MSRTAAQLRAERRQRSVQVDAVVQDLGIDEVFAEVLPEDKDIKVRELQAAGRRVAGGRWRPKTLRRSRARTEASRSAPAPTSAIEPAKIVRASDDPRGVLSILRLAQAGIARVLQTLGWALGYKAVALTVSTSVAAPAGLTIRAWAGGNPDKRLDDGRRAQRAAVARARPAPRSGGRMSVPAGPTMDASERNLAQLDAALAELPDGVRAESEVLMDDPADALVSVSPDLDLSWSWAHAGLARTSPCCLAACRAASR